MSDHKKRKRSRSGPRDDHRHKRKRDEKIEKLEEKIDNLTKVVEAILPLVHIQKEQATNITPANDKLENHVMDDMDNNTNNVLEEEKNEQQVDKESLEILKVLGVDPNDSKFKNVKYHPELKNTWLKWILEGLPEKNKTEILESYDRKGKFYVESPKLNLEIIPFLSDIAKKRDQHFVGMQNCVGTAMAALAAAVSVLLDPPKDGVDEELFTDYISHAGQILADVFHQQSIARKSFITPQLNKGVKSVVDTLISDKWLYGDNLKEKVKDVKEIEKACADIKDKPKPMPKTRDQGNSKYPLTKQFRQVGQQQKFRKPSFKPRRYKPSQNRSTSQTTSRSSSKK